MKSLMFDDTVFKATIMFDFGFVHMFLFFMTTTIYQDTYFFLFVVTFMPVFSIAGLYIKERCKSVWISRIMNDHIDSETNQILCFLYLIFLYMQENDQTWSQLIRLQQIHYLKCHRYFSSVEKKMKEHHRMSMLVRDRQRGLEQEEEDDSALDTQGHMRRLMNSGFGATEDITPIASQMSKHEDDKGDMD